MERACGIGTPPAGELLQKHVTSTTPSSSPHPLHPLAQPQPDGADSRCRREDCVSPWRRPKPEASALPTDETSLICASATTVRDIT